MGYWQHVQALIKKKNTTQEWVASKIGVRADTFSRWIRRNTLPDIETAQSIALALGVDFSSEDEMGFMVHPYGQSSMDCGSEPPFSYNAVNPVIKKITDDLVLLSDSELQLIAVQVAALVANAKARQAKQA